MKKTRRRGKRLALAAELPAQNRSAEAVENYQKLLAENPAYPDRQAIANKLAALTAPPPAATATNAPAK